MPGRGLPETSLAQHETLVPARRDLVAFLDVSRKPADVGHEHARLAGDVDAQVPRTAGVAQRTARRLADVRHPLLLRRQARLDAPEVARAQVGDAVGDPVDV